MVAISSESSIGMNANATSVPKELRALGMQPAASLANLQINKVVDDEELEQ